ncbi:MAG: ABC transporter permease subunit [Candidatus Hydrogenedentes bacterium]|nr:ABC transporter permease subunit [Candidatus Hydrogenedentota bacterium]
MNNTWAVCKREFASYFLTPVGYVVVGMVALISGLSFAMSFLTHVDITQSPTTFAYSTVPDFEESLLSPFLVFCGMLIMFLSPLITMRLLAEERHRGTIELLLTHPLRDREIVFGKYFAALGMLLVMMLIVSVHLMVVGYFVDVEPAVLVFGVLTVFLMGAAFISLGLFISSISRNQITAGTLTFGLLLLLFIVGNAGEKLPEISPMPETYPAMLRAPFGFVYATFRTFVMELLVDAHAKDMAQGIFQPHDVLYYVLFSAFFLFLTFRALESRNWRG